MALNRFSAALLALSAFGSVAGQMMASLPVIDTFFPPASPPPPKPQCLYIDSDCAVCPREYRCPGASYKTCPPSTFPPPDAKSLYLKAVMCMNGAGQCGEYGFINEPDIVYADTFMTKDKESFDISNVFDSAKSNPWVSLEQFPSFSGARENMATVMYKHPVPRILKRYTITARSDAPNHAQAPTRWMLSASGSDYRALLHSAVTPDWKPGETRTFTINNNLAFDKYTWTFTHTNAEFVTSNVPEDRVQLSIQKMTMEFHQGPSFPRCACPRGMFFANGTCNYCPVDHYCDGSDALPVACPSGGTNGTGTIKLWGCFCSPGSYGPSARNCSLCPENHHCSQVTIDPVPCRAGTLSPAGAVYSNQCRCPAGFFDDGEACSVCPAEMFCSPNHATMMPCPGPSNKIGAKSEADCGCPAGYYDLDGKCAECPAGSYCTGNALIKCPSDKMSSQNKSASLNDCKCDSGMYRSESECFECPVGPYCELSDRQSCPQNSATITKGAKKIQDCVCEAGFHGVYSNCRVCVPGTFCPANSSIPQACPRASFCPDGQSVTACPANSTTLIANAVDVNSCLCPPGMTLRNASCTPCDSNRYKSTYGNGRCLILPALAVQTANRDGWECNQNATLQGDQCVPCAEGTYKLLTGNATCVDCRNAVISCEECNQTPSFLCTVCASVLKCETDDLNMVVVYASTAGFVGFGLIASGLMVFVARRKSQKGRTPSNANLLDREKPPTGMTSMMGTSRSALTNTITATSMSDGSRTMTSIASSLTSVYAVVPGFMCIQHAHIRIQDTTTDESNGLQECVIDPSQIPEASKPFMKSGKKLVVKSISDADRGRDAVMQEISILFGFRNYAITKLIAFTDDPISIVMINYPTNLERELNDSTDKKWDDAQLKLKAAREIASVLEVLHRNGVAHTAVKPKNILIEYSPSDQFKQRPKMVLSDFGSAIIFNGAKLIGRQHGSSGQAATTATPSAVDVFRFGMTIFHLFARRDPLGEYDKEDAAERIRDGRYLDDIKDATMSAAAMELVLSCVAVSPESRLPIPLVKAGLERLLEL